MPELPDVTVYVDALRARVVGQVLGKVRLTSPFVLRSVDPPLSAAENKRVVSVDRLGKRIVFGLEDELFLIVHLMVAGRFQWKEPGAKANAKIGLGWFEFGEAGTLVLTEASTKKRASVHLVRGREALAAFDRGGLEVLDADLAAFQAALTRENRTLKRAMTDPRILSGIGNAYSDEILFAARLSPARLTRSLTDDEVRVLYDATRRTLNEWVDLLRRHFADKFPDKVTAFRPEMAVHGRFGKACVVCGDPVQRIAYADNETNYCATCQTGGKLLKDRALSQLLKKDWPKTLEELEEYRAARKG